MKVTTDSIVGFPNYVGHEWIYLGESRCRLKFKFYFLLDPWWRVYSGDRNIPEKCNADELVSTLQIPGYQL